MLLDCRNNKFAVTTNQVCQWANRRTGVGFDQLIVLEVSGVQLRYRFFNADGTEAEQCGNGQRAIAHYLHHQGIQVSELELIGLGGSVQLTYHDQDHIEVNLQQTATTEFKNILGYDGYVVNVGNPHWAFCVDDVEHFDLTELSLQLNDYFDGGVNIEAIERINADHVQIRIIERGVGETLACGSGACAAAIASGLMLNTRNQLKVSMPGGDLQINYDQECGNIKLTGPARSVFKGTINYER